MKSAFRLAGVVSVLAVSMSTGTMAQGRAADAQCGGANPVAFVVEVVDATDRVVPGATVYRLRDRSIAAVVVTDARGRAAVGVGAPDSLRLVVIMPGFKPAAVDVGATNACVSNIRVRLEVGAGWVFRKL